MDMESIDTGDTVDVADHGPPLDAQCVHAPAARAGHGARPLRPDALLALAEAPRDARAVLRKALVFPRFRNRSASRPIGTGTFPFPAPPRAGRSTAGSSSCKQSVNC